MALRKQDYAPEAKGPLDGMRVLRVPVNVEKYVETAQTRDADGIQLDLEDRGPAPANEVPDHA